MSRKNRVNVIAFLSFFFVVLFFTLTASEGPHPDPLTFQEGELLRHIRERHEKTRAIKATVIQDKTLVQLKEPVHVEGTVILEKQGMLRWEARVPEKSVTIIDRDTIRIYYPDDGEAEIHKLSDHFIARSTMTFFGSVMWGTMEDMEKRFIVSVRQSGGELLFELEPRSKIVSRYLSSIVIYYSSQTGMPRGFEVTTPRGDRTVTRIEELTVNPEIAADTFTLKLPSDVRVRDYTVTVDTN